MPLKAMTIVAGSKCAIRPDKAEARRTIVFVELPLEHWKGGWGHSAAPVDARPTKGAGQREHMAQDVPFQNAPQSNPTWGKGGCVSINF